MQTRYYRSKIGRLPFRFRTELCERMRDGATGVAILEWVNASPEFAAVRKETGCGELNAQNLTDWRTTGYADWLTEQDKTERLRSLASLSESIALQTGGDPAAVGSRILAGRLLDALEEADPQTQGELVKAFTMLRGSENDAERTRLQGEKQKLDASRLDLERSKFQRQTCVLFLQWYEDEKAKDVVEDRSLDNDAKTEALGRLMFGKLWETSKN
jgi:hypothetical protein